MDNEKSLLKVSDHLFNGISDIINVTRSRVAVYVNAQASMMFWHIGGFIIKELNYETYSAYGDKILATLSQRLTEKYGKGYSYSALTRMIKVASIYNNEQMFATLSQTLSWAHFIELITIKNDTKRLYYQQMGIAEHWSVRELRERQDKMVYERSLIAAKPEDEILTSLKNTTPEHLDPDVVFKNSYIVNFLGLGNDYSESELEDALLCSEGNTEHIELLMLDEKNIKVAQYLTYLPDKQWFIEKLNRSIMIAKECSQNNKTRI